MVGVSPPGLAQPCRGHVCPPPPAAAVPEGPSPHGACGRLLPHPPLHQPPELPPNPDRHGPTTVPSGLPLLPPLGGRGSSPSGRWSLEAGVPGSSRGPSSTPVVGFWFGAVWGGSGFVLILVRVGSWHPRGSPPPFVPLSPPGPLSHLRAVLHGPLLKSPLTPAPRNSFPCSFGWTACPSPPSAGLPAWLGSRPRSVARPDPALIGPVGSEGPRRSPELPFLRVGGSRAPEEGLEIQGLTPAPAGQPQRGWYFLPPPPPSQAVWQRPERSWWGFPRFLLGVPGWGGGAGGSWWAFWREPVQFRTVGGGWGGGECPFPLSEGPQGPPGWPLLSGGCSFCLHTAATGNSLPQGAACALVSYRENILYFNFAECNFSHPYTLGAQGFTALLLWAPSIPSLLRGFPIWPPGICILESVGQKRFSCQGRDLSITSSTQAFLN